MPAVVPVEAWRAAPAPSRARLYQMLVPLDGHPASEAVLPVVESLARDSGAIVRLVRVVEARPDQAADVEAHASGEAAAYLAGVAETLRERGVPRVFWSVWHAPPGRAICRAAVQNAVDLIVLGGHGRGGGRLPLGGVAEHVVREASAPVLLLAVAVVPVSADGGLPAPLDARRLRRRSSWW